MPLKNRGGKKGQLERSINSLHEGIFDGLGVFSNIIVNLASRLKGGIQLRWSNTCSSI